MSLEEYLKLFDWCGRQVRGNKQGAIPADLAAIVDRARSGSAEAVDARMRALKEFWPMYGIDPKSMRYDDDARWTNIATGERFRLFMDGRGLLHDDGGFVREQVPLDEARRIQDAMVAAETTLQIRRMHLDGAEADLGRAKHSLWADRRAAAFSILADIRPMGRPFGNVEASSPLEPDEVAADAVREAGMWYPADWVDAAERRLGNLVVTDVGNERGYYQRPGRNGSAARIATNVWSVEAPGVGDRDAVAVHEIGHHMEEAIPGLRGAEWAFWWRRTQEPGRAEQDLTRFQSLAERHPNSGYRESERTVPDHFGEDYTGKVYDRADPDSTWEVFTVGIQQLTTNSVPNAFRSDPDYEAFILGALATLGYQEASS